MKNFYFILLISIYGGCFAQKPKIIREIKEYSFKDIQTGEILRICKLNSTSKFDSTGKKVEEVFYDTNEKTNRSIVYNYNVLGDCFEISEYNGSGNKIKEIKANLDKNGKIIPFFISNSFDFCNQKSPFVKCSCNKEGNVIEAIKYDEIYKTMIILKLKYEYTYW